MVAATSLGAVPFFFVELDPQWAGICNGIVAGVMLAVSFDLIQEGQGHGIEQQQIQECNSQSVMHSYNLHIDNWVEPLSKFTEEIGETSKYRGFLYQEYQALRMRNKTHPPVKPKDVIRITHYAITS
ncbi:hypothetical protein Q3G72_019239 [Acer saccharum]|nr:hypothetical protein Q3G72_019239 [Acer saccharum]